MSVYSYKRRSKNPQRYIKIALLYLSLVIMRFLISETLFTIVVNNDLHKEMFFSLQGQTENRATYRILGLTNAQRIFVGTRFIKNKFSNVATRDKTISHAYGDIVLVKKDREEKQNILILNVLLRLAGIFTLGFVEDNRQLAFQEVVAVPGDTVVYNINTIFSVNGKSFSTSIVDSDQENPIPLFENKKTITLEKHQYFLIGTEVHEGDGKLWGPTNEKKIIGKALLLLGPKWGNIYQ